MRFDVVLALLVSDEQGNAKALTSGTSDRTGSTFSRVNSFKNVFHTLSYRFDAIISLRFYLCGKGKRMNDYGQGGIADTLTIFY